jgi:hypothetical protein
VDSLSKPNSDVKPGSASVPPMKALLKQNIQQIEDKIKPSDQEEDRLYNAIVP